MPNSLRSVVPSSAGGRLIAVSLLCGGALLVAAPAIAATAQTQYYNSAGNPLTSEGNHQSQAYGRAEVWNNAELRNVKYQRDTVNDGVSAYQESQYQYQNLDSTYGPFGGKDRDVPSGSQWEYHDDYDNYSSGHASSPKGRLQTYVCQDRRPFKDDQCSNQKPIFTFTL